MRLQDSETSWAKRCHRKSADLAQGRISTVIDGVPVRFLPCEYEVFMYLWNRRGVPATPKMIADDLSDEDGNPTTDSVKVQISWIRRKLEGTRFRIPYNRNKHVGLGLVRI